MPVLPPETYVLLQQLRTIESVYTARINAMAGDTAQAPELEHGGGGEHLQQGREGGGQDQNCNVTAEGEQCRDDRGASSDKPQQLAQRQDSIDAPLDTSLINVTTSSPPLPFLPPATVKQKEGDIVGSTSYNNSGLGRQFLNFRNSIVSSVYMTKCGEETEEDRKAMLARKPSEYINLPKWKQNCAEVRSILEKRGDGSGGGLGDDVFFMLSIIRRATGLLRGKPVREREATRRLRRR